MGSPARIILLAAGAGARCWPLTATRPKPLLPVANEPLLVRLMRQARAAGCTAATVVVTDPRGPVASAALGAGKELGLDVALAVQAEPRGTGHALACAGPFAEDVLVANGDVFVDDAAFGAVTRAPGDAAIATAQVANAGAYGRAEVEGARFLRVAEKAGPGPGCANAGLYRFPAGFERALGALAPSPRGELELTDALNALAAGGDTRVSAVPVHAWSDVGWPWELLDANAHALASLEPSVDGTVETGARLVGPVHVARGAVVRSGAVIEGPVLVGPGARVGPNCFVRGPTVLGEGSRVGQGCEVKASVLFPHAAVPHLSYVGDSVLGEGVNLGAGTIVANLRHDDANVRALTPRGRIDTGRRKLGVVLGDGVKTGIGTRLNVGVLLGPREATAPGEVVTRSRPLPQAPPRPPR